MYAHTFELRNGASHLVNSKLHYEVGVPKQMSCLNESDTCHMSVICRNKISQTMINFILVVIIILLCRDNLY